MASDFDPLVYTRGPILDVPSAYSLAVAILSAVPEGDARGEGIRVAAQALRDKVVSLRAAWTANVKHVSIDRRPIDAVADASWRSMSNALEAVSLLQGTDEDDALAKPATALLGRLFPNGLSFTQGSFTVAGGVVAVVAHDLDRELGVGGAALRLPMEAVRAGAEAAVAPDLDAILEHARDALGGHAVETPAARVAAATGVSVHEEAARDHTLLGAELLER